MSGVGQLVKHKICSITSLAAKMMLVKRYIKYIYYYHQHVVKSLVNDYITKLVEPKNQFSEIIKTHNTKETLKPAKIIV